MKGHEVSEQDKAMLRQAAELTAGVLVTNFRSAADVYGRAAKIAGDLVGYYDSDDETPFEEGGVADILLDEWIGVWNELQDLHTRWIAFYSLPLSDETRAAVQAANKAAREGLAAGV